MSTIEVKGASVVITIPIQDLGLSSSGKNTLVANHNGNNGLKVTLPNGKLATYTVTGYHKP